MMKLHWYSNTHERKQFQLTPSQLEQFRITKKVAMHLLSYISQMFHLC